MTIVFTAILGDCDSLKPAPLGADLAVCFVTDKTAHVDSKGWDLVTHPAENPRREAWRLRAVPHTLFSAYDRVIWIDASFTLTNLPLLLKDAGTAPIAAIRHHKRRSCYEEAREIARIGQGDSAQVEKQMRTYRGLGFRPDHLSISCVIVRDNSAAVLGFNDRWAAEFQHWTGDNTQLSLDYAAWSNDLDIKALQGTRHLNPYATHDHDDHKRRRKPYDKPTFGSFGKGAAEMLHGTEAVVTPEQAKEFQ